MTRRRKIDDGSQPAEDESALDPIRQLVLRRSRELRLSLAALSREVNRNEAYLHQFVWRGSPKDLPETTRKHLAQTLGLDEASLRGGEEPMAIPSSIMTLPGRAAVSPPDVPVVRLGDRLDAAPSEWAPRPPTLATVTNAFALWVPVAIGRSQPGDLAYVHPSQPPRPGDMVVVVEDQRISRIGEMLGFDELSDGRERRQIDRLSQRLCKVVWLMLA
jgi:hypothetical protein